MRGPERRAAAAAAPKALVELAPCAAAKLEPDVGQLMLMSLEMIMRDVLMSKRTSHEPEDSKIGFVTPAMYAGLQRVKEMASWRG